MKLKLHKALIVGNDIHKKDSVVDITDTALAESLIKRKLAVKHNDPDPANAEPPKK